VDSKVPPPPESSVEVMQVEDAYWNGHWVLEVSDVVVPIGPTNTLKNEPFVLTTCGWLYEQVVVLVIVRILSTAFYGQEPRSFFSFADGSCFGRMLTIVIAVQA